jgi:DHA3 family macrolide efflux protein-like MFS transporter
MNNDKESVVKQEKYTSNFSGFMLIFSGQIISLFGSSIVQFAMSWYLAQETGSEIILSLATFCGLLPMVIISPFAGVITDRFSRKWILIISDMLTAFATLIIIILFILGVGDIWQILVLLAVRGFAQGFQFPASMSVQSTMVPQNKLPKVNALNSILNSLIFIASPAIGALATEFFSIEQILWLDVFTFIPAAIILFLVKIPKLESEVKNIQEVSFKKDFLESFNYLKTSKIIYIIILFALVNIFINPLFSLLPLFIIEKHSGGVVQYGLLQIFFQVGIFSGGFIMMLWKGYKPRFKSVIISASFLGLGMLILGLMPSGIFWLLYITATILGIILAFIDTQVLTVLQIVIPKETQGRIFSTTFVFIKVLLPIALIGWGFLAESIGLTIVFIVSPILTLIITFIILLTTPVLELDKIHFNEIEKNVLNESVHP